jgi:hypothetical protein
MFASSAKMQGIQWTNSPFAQICIQEFATNFYQVFTCISLGYQPTQKDNKNYQGRLITSIAISQNL